MFDFLIIGAGIGGASIAQELSGFGSILLLEQEAQPGYHSTGRSAALLTENYGNDAIRILTVSSRNFFEEPPEIFGDARLLHPRGMLMVARADQQVQVSEDLARAIRHVPSMRKLDQAETLQLCPALNRDYVDSATFEPHAMDLDVNAIHQGYLRGFRRAGGEIRLNAGVTGLEHRDNAWAVQAGGVKYLARTVVNAAGAWADEIASMAGGQRVGLIPKRRTGIIFESANWTPDSAWPCVMDLDETFYFKPESGRLMGSPADQTPMAPGDVQPEELDIAEAVDRIERATTINVSRISSRWAGLRSFVGDGAPVVGFDPLLPDFFWLAGQGGYGVMTAPALSRLASSLLTRREFPVDLRDAGLSEAHVSPSRFPQPSRGNL